HTNRAFAGTPRDERVERVLRPNMVYGDALGAFDGDEIVGTAHHEEASITLPGGRSLDCPGVTRVSVSPTHRRQGVLTAVMRAQLALVHEQGAPLAALWASETPIYGRFGYGLATVHEAWKIDRDDTALASWAPPPQGRVRFVEPEDAQATFRPLYDALAASRPGGMRRIDYRWEAYLEDPEHEREGASPLNLVVYESPEGVHEGYAWYRMKGAWPENVPHFTLNVGEFVALTPEAELGLWRYLFGIDLVGTIEAHDQPLDAALPWVLADFRRLARRPSDGLYVRVLDVPAAFEARTYAAADRLVLSVDDPTCEWVTGRYALETGPEGAAVTRTEEDADLAMHPAALATVLFGAQPASVLGRAGLIEERR
ncbi:MAG: GNAT family N-acetyltransferase, partial [Dehalococcoidia bacterium]